MHAQTTYLWQLPATQPGTGSGSWATAANWSPAGPANGTGNVANFTRDINATSTVTLDGARTIGTLIFGDGTTGAGTNDWVLNTGTGGPLTLDVATGNANIQVLNRVATIGAVLAGNDGVSVSNGGGPGGTLILGAANTFTGGLNIAGTIVQLNNNTAAGNNQITINPSTAVGRLAVNGGVTIANAVSFGNTTGVAGFGVLQQVGTGLATINGPINITGGPSAGGHFVGGGAATNALVLGGPITSTVGLVQRAGVVRYGGGGSYSLLTVTGTAQVGATNGLSTTAGVILGGSEAAALELNGFDQTLSSVTLGNSTNPFAGTVNLGNRTLTLNGNVTAVGSTGNASHLITATPGGVLSFGNTPRTLAVNDNPSADDLSIEGVSVVAGGGLTKTGAGTLALSGSNIAGTLSIDAGTLATGRLGQVGSFTTTGLTFGPAGTTLRMKVGSSGDQISVTGANALTNNGVTTVNLSQLGGALPNGTYRLINYTGTSPGLSGFALNQVGHVTGGLIDTGSAIALQVTGNDQIVWDGTNSNAWSTGTTGNWKLLSTNAPTDYFESDDVIFQDGPTSSTVDIATNVNPSNVTFINSTATNYLVTGTGGIIGATGLTKSNSGVTTLRAQSSYTGATNILGGTLELDHDATGNQVLTGTSGVNVSSGTTLRLTRDDGDFTFTRNLTGSGTVVVDPHSVSAGAARSVTLNGNNVGFTGLIRLAPTVTTSGITGGFRWSLPSAASAGSGSIDVEDSAQFWAAGVTYNNPIEITGIGFIEAAGSTPVAAAGLGTLGGLGAIRMENNAVLNGPVTLNGNAKVTAFNATGTIAGPISSVNPGDQLVVGGGTSSSTLILTGANSYGPTFINSGSGTSTVTHTLQIGNNGTTGTLGTGDVTLYGETNATALVRFRRSDGYSLQQNILGANVLGRTTVDIDSTGAGVNLNGRTIDLSDGTVGGAFRVGVGIAGATLNVTPGSLVDVGTFFMGEAANQSGIVNQSGGTVNFITQMRVGHFPTETSVYNLSGGTLTGLGAATATFPYTTGATEQNGGIYLGIDGTGVLTQTGGTLTTNFLVLDNRGETNAGANTPTGVDTYTLSGGTLALKNAYGIITRNATTAVNLNGGTVQALGVSPNLDSNKITVTGTVLFDTNGANTFNLYGPLAGNGTISLQGGGTFRTVDGTGATLTQVGGGTFGGSLGNTMFAIAAGSTLAANRTGSDLWTNTLSGTGNFLKQNTGVLTLTGPNGGFTGIATISGGRLNLNSTFNASVVNVGDGAALGGEITLTNLTVGSTAGGTIFFDPNTPGALSVANLAVNGSSTLDFATAPTGNGTFLALNYGSRTGAGAFSLANAAAYRPGTVSVADNGSTVQVNVTGTKDLTWTGAANATWAVNSGANFNDGAAPDVFFAGDRVTFSDGAANPAITVASGVSPWRTVVDSNVTAYTFTSTNAGIAGPGNLEKSGSSTLTLTGPNTYSGKTIITGGTVSIATGASLGNGDVTNDIVLDGGTLRTTAAVDLGVARTLTVLGNGGTISATGTLTIPGSLDDNGTLTLNSSAAAAPLVILSGASPTFGGEINVTSVGATTGGTTLRLTNNHALVSGTVTLAQSTVAGQSNTLDLANVDLSPGVTVSMNSNAGGNFRSQITASVFSGTLNGPLVMNGDGLNQISSATLITINSDVTAGAAGFNGIMLLRGTGAGVINGNINLPNGFVTKTDASTWTVNSTGNNWAGTAVQSSGSIKLGIDNALPITAPLTIGQASDAAASSFDLNGFDQEVPVIAYVAGTANSTRGVTNTSSTLSTFTVRNEGSVSYGASTGITGGLLTGNLELVKFGAGPLTLAGANSFTGNVTVNEGTLIAGGSTVTSLGNATIGGRTVTVNSGAALNFTTNNVFGNGIGNNNLPAIVLNGSTLSSTRYNVLGNLTLNGATLTQSSTDAGNYEGFQFRGTVTVGGNAPSFITSGNGKANHLAANTTFNVTDVTSNAAADLIISAPLRSQSGDFGLGSSTLTKTGLGTLQIDSTQNYAALVAADGDTILNTSVGTGASTITVGSADVVANVNQTLASLTIGDGGTFTLGELGNFGILGPVAPSEGPGAASAFTNGSPVQAVPEPGSLGLLAAGVLAFFGRRRRH